MDRQRALQASLFKSVGIIVWAILALNLSYPTWSAVAANWPFDDAEFGNISIGPRAMWFDPLDANARWFGGAQARLYLSTIFAIEGSVDYRRNEFGPNTRTDTYPVQVSLLAYLLPGKRLTPFLLGGGGWYYTHVKAGEFSDTQNRFGLHAGGGLQYFINKHWSIDSTYRFVWLESLASRDVNLINKDFQDSGHMVTIGLNFHF